MNDPLTGHWLLDLALSAFSSHAPRGWELFIQADSLGMSVEEHLTQADGTLLLVSFTLRFDGRDYPAAGSSFFNAIAVERPEARRLEVTARKDAAVTIRDTTEVSADDQMLTVRYEIFTEGRVVVTGRAIFRKVRD